MEKKVSIILPTYNRAGIIKKSNKSKLVQTYPNLDLIIVDDKSNDDTPEVINAIEDPRIKYIKLEKNIGGAGARNVGIQESNYEYVAFQDSDDIWYPNKLELQMKELSELTDKYAMVYCSFKRDYGSVSIIPSNKIKKTSGSVYSQLLRGNFISTQTILCKKEVLNKVKCFDEKLPAAQDWDLVLRIAKHYKIKHINKILVELRISNDSITKNKKNHFIAIQIIFNKIKDDLSYIELVRWKYLVGSLAYRIGLRDVALFYISSSMNMYSKYGFAAILKYFQIQIKNK